MTISMYKASAPIFAQFLTSLSAVLDKAAAHAEAKKIDPAVLLNARLYPDMFPLARQVREATNHAASACGRVAGVDLPSFPNTEASIPELKERIARTIDFIKGLKPAQIDGTEDKEITIKFPSGAAQLRRRGRQTRLHGHARHVVSRGSMESGRDAAAGGIGISPSLHYR